MSTQLGSWLGQSKRGGGVGGGVAGSSGYGRIHVWEVTTVRMIELERLGPRDIQGIPE